MNTPSAGLPPFLSIGVQRGPCIGVRPCGWTESSGSFDRLLGVLILELHGADIAERGMKAFAIVNLVDEPWKVGGDILERLVGRQVDGLNLQLFMKLSALALSYGLPRRLIEPIRPFAASSSR